MIYVGLTGGIGSGKTTVARVFQILGIPVYYSDLRAKSIMTHNDKVKLQIIDIFGNQAYTTDNKLNSSYIASEAFSNKKKLATLNQIVHGVVMEDFFHWAQTQPSKYVINESAILIESGYYRQMSVNIVVIADEDTRIQRIIKRDKTDTIKAKDRLTHQTNDTVRREHADYIITNNNDLIIEQIITIHKRLWENSRNG